MRPAGPRGRGARCHLARLLTALLLLPAALPALPGAGASVPPFGIGDWVVSGDETFQDGVLLLDGNLTVMPGGSLTISNSTLTVYSSFDAEHQIRVRSGGALWITDGSVISAFDRFKAFGFWFEEGSRALLRDSTFISCGIWYAEINQQIIGGLVSYTDDLTVQNCTFAGSHVGITTFNHPTTIERTTFRENYIGAINIDCEMTYLNCTFESDTYAAWPYSSTAEFTDCSFRSNSIGISSDGSTCNITRCNFSNNNCGVLASAMMHWFMPPSTLNVEDCLFQGNYDGIGHYPDLGRNTLKILNCDFIDNSHFAILWDNSGWDGLAPVSFTSWNTSRDCRVVNSTVDLNGRVFVEAGGRLTFWNSTFLSDTSGDIESHVPLEVLSGGALALEANSTFRTVEAGYPYSLRCRPGSAFRMNGSLLRDCGWDSPSIEERGPYFETPDVRLSYSSVDFCPQALVLVNCSGAVVDGCGLRAVPFGDPPAGIRMTGSSVLLVNSSVVSVGGWSAHLERSSFLDCLSSSLDNSSLRFEDAGCRVNVSWYLGASVRWADETPVEGAFMIARDREGREAGAASTKEDGSTGELVLRQASISPDLTAVFTPHSLNCSKGPIWNLTTWMMDRSRKVRILLADTEGPSVQMRYPEEGAALGTGTVLFSGKAEDNLAVSKVEVVVDGYRRALAYEGAGGEVRSVNWSASLSLAEGFHWAEVWASDPSGNLGQCRANFTIDVSAPMVRISRPQDGLLTRHSLLAVEGYTEPGARVFLQGAEVGVEKNFFKGTLTLAEELNRITAVALDAAGNSNSSWVLVTLDTVAPDLAVASPADGWRTNRPWTDVCGTVETDGELLVNGRLVALTGEAGTFRTAVALVPGANLITVEALDRAQNRAVVVRKVVLDALPPHLSVLYPPEGALLNSPGLVASGTCEAGAVLGLAGESRVVEGPEGTRVNFTLAVSLQEGTNTLLFRAEDAAGNVNFTARHATLDTAPPPLTISSPADGTSTSAATVLLTGSTEPGALLSVSGATFPAGLTGSFSVELRLSSGLNRFRVRAEDPAGNWVERELTVNRTAAPGGVLVLSDLGPDVPYILFTVVSASLVAAEGYHAARRLGRRGGTSKEGG